MGSFEGSSTGPGSKTAARGLQGLFVEDKDGDKSALALLFGVEYLV